MNVKNNSKGYPEAIMREQVPNCDDRFSMQTSMEDMDFYSSIYIDK